MIKKKEATTKQNESRLIEKPLISDCMWYFKCKAKPRRNAYFFQVPFSLVSHCIGSGIWQSDSMLFQIYYMIAYYITLNVSPCVIQ